MLVRKTHLAGGTDLLTVDLDASMDTLDYEWAGTEDFQLPTMEELPRLSEFTAQELIQLPKCRAVTIPFQHGLRLFLGYPFKLDMFSR